MALLTKGAVEAQLAISTGAVQALEEKYDVSVIKRSLTNQIKDVEAKEKLFLDALGANSIEEVNQRLERIKTNMPSISNLNGPSLEKEFLNAAQASYENMTSKKKQEFIYYFSQAKGYQNFLTPNDFASWLHGVLNGVRIGHVSAKHGYIDATALEQVVYEKLTKAQKERAELFIKQQKADSKNEKIDVKQTGAGVFTTLTVSDWNSITGGKRQKQIEKMLDNGEMTKDELLKAIGEVEKLINSKVSGDSFFKEAVKEILYQPNTLTQIYMGGNIVNGITGLLGEIQGLYYIKALLNDPKANKNSIIKWVGGVSEDGHKPHEDLILMLGGEKLGIQVKNTAKNLEELRKLENVGFANRAASSFSDIKEALGSSYDDIMKVYEMYAFNIEYDVEYKKGKRTYVARGNPAFSSTRGSIESLRSRLDKAMAMFAASLMFMSMSSQMDPNSIGNGVYLIGGHTFQLASEVLTNLFDSLGKEGKEFGFKVTSYFRKGASGVGTIVDYFNSKRGKRGGSVSEALGTLFLSSSYTFEL